jgi:hypothetical protein
MFCERMKAHGRDREREGVVYPRKLTLLTTLHGTWTFWLSFVGPI